MTLALRLGVLLLAAFATGAQARPGVPEHGIAMHGEPALPPGFDHPRYANPAAPKGGRLTQGVLGTFDSLNPFVVRGLALSQIRGYVVESLLARGYDEPFTLYGLLARTVETDAGRTYVTFALDPAAKFSDGRPVTAEDVIFSWQLLRDKGRPNYRTYYVKVARAEALSERVVRFDLTGANDRELPLILGLMPVLPKHAINPDTFEDTTFEPMLGTGPYVVAKVDAGRSISLKRDPNYWGRDLAINRGLWNFDEVRFDFYRDGNSHLEAFKKGLYDVRTETDPGRWETAYDVPAVRDGRIVKETFPYGLPKIFSGLVFNTRRPVFSDIRVREAIGMLLDFEWLNHNYFYDRYARSASYFEGSELSARGRPAEPRERALLAPFPDAVRADFMDGTWQPTVSDGSGRDRSTLKRALALLDQAGYALDGTVLRSRATRKPLGFEVLVTTRDQERLALAFSRDLKRAGIAARVRVVDAVQYDRRRLTYDYDMIENRWDQSLSPGNEQAFYWSSAAADADGTRNYMGVKSAAIDAMIAALLKANERDEFVAAVRALDRVLMSGFYVVPLYHLPAQWVARWTTIGHPAETSLFGYLPETWWHEAGQMILGDTRTEHLPATTLDDVFRRAAARRPGALALTDPPDRESFTDGPPRHLTYAEANRAVSAIASRLRTLGLPTDAVVGIQLPNTIESVLTMLGVLRAGLIAAPLPLLWRRADMGRALGQVGAKAIVTTARIGGFDACTTAMQVAADVFSIRHVCSFGRNLLDGVIALDGLLQDAAPELPPEIERSGNPAAHVAVVTFDVTPDGHIAVARNHAELIAGGLANMLEGRIEPEARLLGCCATGSFAGLSLTMMPWLLSGGTLLLHHGFDDGAFAAQCYEHGPDTVVLPGALVPQLAESGLLAHDGLTNVIAAWRAPERCLASPAWRHSSASLTDIHIFGEIGLLGSRRGAAVPLPLNAAMAPKSANAVPVADIARTASGTLSLRGPMVPRYPFPPGAERFGSPHLKADPEGFVDTFFPCRLDRISGTVTVTGPPPGIVSVGSYRFVLRELEDLVRRADGGAFITALPDALAGHRLAGISGGSGDMRATLARLGINPLVADAFGAA